MTHNAISLFGAVLLSGFLAMAQKPPEKPKAPAAQPASDLAESLAQRLSKELHVKAVVGQPVKAGEVTLIPLLMVDVNFGGAGVAAPGGAPGADGFLMSGEARPLGFVAITKSKTTFISAVQPPAK